MGALICLSLLQLKTPSILAELANTTKSLDTNEGEESEKNPEPVPDPLPNPPPENEEDSPPPPESKPEREQEVPAKPKPETEAKEPSGSTPGGNSNQKPVQSDKPMTNWQRPPAGNSGSNSVKNNWSTPNVPSNNTTTNNVDSQIITNVPTEEIITEVPEPEIEVEIEEEVNVEDYSIEVLIQMIERGEAKGEIRGEKYFVIFQDELEDREVTKEEAIKLGIIQENQEQKVDIDLPVVEESSEPIELVADVKSKKTKMPVYISAVGLATVIIGAFMYIIQWRKSVKK